MSLQNMPFGHIDYFKGTLKSRGCKKGTLTFLSLLESRRYNSPVQGALSVPGGKKHSYHQRRAIKERNLYKQTLLN